VVEKSAEEGRFDELSSRLRKVESSEDVVRALAENWQKAAGALLVVLLIVWLYGQIREAKQTRIGESSLRFSGVQQSFHGVSEPPAPAQKPEDAAKAEEERKNLERKFSDNASTLRDTFGDSNYAELTTAYDALRQLNLGDSSAAEKLLQTGEADALANSSTFPLAAKAAPDDLTRELKALVYARALMVKDAARAKAVLRGLVFTGKIASVEALVALTRMAGNESERGEVLALAKRLSTERPEVAQLVRDELSNLGISLDEAKQS
jgi:hypothetical protein